MDVPGMAQFITETAELRSSFQTAMNNYLSAQLLHQLTFSLTFSLYRPFLGLGPRPSTGPCQQLALGLLAAIHLSSLLCLQLAPGMLAAFRPVYLFVNPRDSEWPQDT